MFCRVSRPLRRFLSKFTFRSIRRNETDGNRVLIHDVLRDSRVSCAPVFTNGVKTSVAQNLPTL